MKQLICIFTALILTASAAVAQTVENPRLSSLVDDLIFGVYCAEEPLRQDPAPGTASGVINIVPELPNMRFQQLVVPADRAVGFGVLVRLQPGLRLDLVDVTVTHPPFVGMALPNAGEDIQIERWVTSMDGDGYSLVGFSFDHPEEEVPGQWSFSASHDGEELFHITFDVVPSAMLPDIPLACMGGALS